MANQLDHLFAALSDPTRRAVVSRLTLGPASVSDLHEPHAMALPTFMRHLKVLEECGLVTSTKKGRVRTFEVQPQALHIATDWLDAHKDVWARRLDRLATLAEQMERTRT